jgi:hypothetical protein
VQDKLGRLDPVITANAERLRDLEARRLDQLTVSLAHGIPAGDLRAVVAAERLMERRAKLFGLDAPKQMDMTLQGELDLVDRLAAPASAGRWGDDDLGGAVRETRATPTVDHASRGLCLGQTPGAGDRGVGDRRLGAR